MTNSEFHFEFAVTLLKFFICTAFLFYFINFKSRCAFAVCLLLSRWSPGNHHNSDWEGSEGSHETGRWNFLQVLQACCRIPAGSHQNWNQRGLWCYFWFSGSQVRKLKKKKAHDGTSSSQVSCSCSCMLTSSMLISSQVGFSHGAAQALGAPLSECPVVQEPSEDAGGQRGHQTRVHWAETECGAAGEQEDEGWEERVYVFATFFKINAWKVKTWCKISSLGFCSFENKADYRFITN